MSKSAFLTHLAIVATAPVVLYACGSEPTTPKNDNATAVSGIGSLEIVANGEDFVRQGFVTKDGWQIDFEHLYVSLAEVTAYQSNPPYDAQAGGQPNATEAVSIDGPVIVDLAAGDADAAPILVGSVEAPIGRYNALSWKMVPSESGPAMGQTLWMEGTASKDGGAIDFVIKLDPTLGFVCGDFVGDRRNGILEGTDTAQMEATFHFDHLFGDGEADPDDEINTGALGFDPLAAIAQDASLDVTLTDLEAQLSPEAYQLLIGILPSLGHVGEGHCNETELSG